DLTPIPSCQSYSSFVAESGAVAGREIVVVHADGSGDDLEPCMPSGSKAMLEGGSSIQERSIELDVLMNRHGGVSTVGSRNESELLRTLGLRERSLFVGRRQTRLRGKNPNLQKMDELGARMIELAVRYARPRTHALNVSRADHRSGAEAVFVLERAVDHVR